MLRNTGKMGATFSTKLIGGLFIASSKKRGRDKGHAKTNMTNHKLVLPPATFMKSSPVAL